MENEEDKNQRIKKGRSVCGCRPIKTLTSKVVSVVRPIIRSTVTFI